MSAATPLPPSGETMPHYISEAPFDPYSVETMTPQQERVFKASPRLTIF